MPVRASGNVPLVGGNGAAVAGPNPTLRPSGEIENASCVMTVLSYEATPMMSVPTPGAPRDHDPVAPLLPADATTTTPLRTSSSPTCEVGYWGHWNAAPRLWLMTCMPSA